MTGITVTLVLVGGLIAGSGSPGNDLEPWAAADDAAVTVGIRLGTDGEHQGTGTDPSLRLEEFRRHPSCTASSVDDTTDLNGPCPHGQGQVALPFCDGLNPVLPLWRRTRTTPASAWSPWTLATPWSCPQEQVPAMTREDLQRLPLAPPTVRIQPDRPEVLINIDTITMTDATTQHFTTDLLGYPVEVEATPTAFTWDYGDDTPPLRTTSPGHPWPDHDVAHVYTQPGTYTITLTTELTGRYRLAGTTTWLPVTGTATTTTTAPPITAVERRSHLVSEPCTPTTC